MKLNNFKISVVTPTFRRPEEIKGLLKNISRQSLMPDEIIIVDGAPGDEVETANVIKDTIEAYPFQIHYLRYEGGTAVQRNAGIERATGDFVALVDDDVRLDEDFLAKIITVFELDEKKEIGGIVGYRTNKHFRSEEASRWRWYKRLRLLKTFEPGRYDFETGYPINNNMQPPFSGVRAVDFMTTACAVWRREVFDSGLRFDSFFRDYGVLEDAHFALRAKKNWTLLQHGEAHCEELSSPNGRANRRRVGYKYVVNYYYVFQDIGRPLTFSKRVRFWRYQAFEFLRIGASAVRRRRLCDAQEFVGRIEGVLAVLRGNSFEKKQENAR